MSSEQFQEEYKAGKEALERGQYGISIERLEKAYQLVSEGSRLGGEVGISLVTAYQAANRVEDAIALCQKLTTHPHPEIRLSGKRILYIIQAPALKRPSEWMTEIPDLAALPESDPKDRRGSSPAQVKQKTGTELEPLDLSSVNTKDNLFIWLALLAIILVLGGLWALS